MTVELIQIDPLPDIQFKTGEGDLHGWPLEQGAQIAVRPVYFWATHNSLHQIGELVSQPIMVHCLLNDLDFDDPIKVFEYLDELNLMIGTPGQLRVTINGNIRSIDDVFFSGWQQLLPAPLPNLVPYPIGPVGNYFTEVILMFTKTKF